MASCKTPSIPEVNPAYVVISSQPQVTSVHNLRFSSLLEVSCNSPLLSQRDKHLLVVDVLVDAKLVLINIYLHSGNFSKIRGLEEVILVSFKNLLIKCRFYLHMSSYFVGITTV